LAGSQAEECIFIDNNVSNLIVLKTLGFQTIFHNHENNDVRRFISLEMMKRESDAED
jgi:FMN phosphatase YigB (HAD superfamily)